MYVFFFTIWCHVDYLNSHTLTSFFHPIFPFTALLTPPSSHSLLPSPHQLSKPLSLSLSLSPQMSVITENSPKHCGATKKSTTTTTFRHLHKRLYFYLTTLLLSLLSLILLIYLILHPSKPQFSLQEANISQLNLSGAAPSLLNSSIQITLQSHNPNSKLSIYYDELLLHASYKGQRISPETPVAPFYQDREETDLLTASLVGLQLPVAPSFAYEVQRDRGTGRLALGFKGMGKLRWKVGSYVSGRYRFVVSCVAFMPIGEIPSPPLRSRQSSQCQTTM